MMFRRFGEVCMVVSSIVHGGLAAVSSIFSGVSREDQYGLPGNLLTFKLFN